MASFDSFKVNKISIIILSNTKQIKKTSKEQ